MLIKENVTIDTIINSLALTEKTPVLYKYLVKKHFYPIKNVPDYAIRKCSKLYNLYAEHRKQIDSKFSILEAIKELKPIVDAYYDSGLSDEQEEQLVEYFYEYDIIELLEEKLGDSAVVPDSIDFLEIHDNFNLDFSYIEMEEFYSIKIFVNVSYQKSWPPSYHDDSGGVDFEGIISLNLDALNNKYLEYEIET
jgi:phage gp36-like protein